jgi:hypothetical protein
MTTDRRGALLERLVMGAALLAIVAVVVMAMRPRVESWIVGPLGREYCREITPCSTSSYEYCIHYVAVDTLDGRPVREGCGACLRAHGCDEALSCTMCGFDGH